MKAPLLQRARQRFRRLLLRRGAVLRRLYTTLGLVSFGSVHANDDDVSVIRGFTASLTHKDAHFAVGTYSGYDIRIVDRFDIVPIKGRKHHFQQWVIIEIELHQPNLRHIFFLPTGPQSSEYHRLFTAQPYMQPINSLLVHNKSPEFHGRFQILARTTHLQDVERLFNSPIIAGIGARFWPHGIEIEHGKLLIYIAEHRLSKAVLETTVASAVWLAEVIDEATD